MQNIILYAGMDRVDVVNDVDWHETHILLKASFKLAASGPKATFEIPYGTIERPTTRNNSVEDAKFEVPAQRWADLGDGQHGFSLINDSKYGYDVKGNDLQAFVAAFANLARPKCRSWSATFSVFSLSACRWMASSQHGAARLRLQHPAACHASGGAHRRVTLHAFIRHRQTRKSGADSDEEERGRQ